MILYDSHYMCYQSSYMFVVNLAGWRSHAKNESLTIYNMNGNVKLEFS